METKFKMITTGNTRDGDHVLYGITAEGTIWMKTKQKGWQKVEGPIEDEK